MNIVKSRGVENEYYIFRDSGMEVKVNINKNSFITSSYPLTDEERMYFGKFNYFVDIAEYATRKNLSMSGIYAHIKKTKTPTIKIDNQLYVKLE